MHYRLFKTAEDFRAELENHPKATVGLRLRNHSFPDRIEVIAAMYKEYLFGIELASLTEVFPELFEWVSSCTEEHRSIPFGHFCEDAQELANTLNRVLYLAHHTKTVPGMDLLESDYGPYSPES